MVTGRQGLIGIAHKSMQNRKEGLEQNPEKHQQLRKGKSNPQEIMLKTLRKEIPAIDNTILESEGLHPVQWKQLWEGLAVQPKWGQKSESGYEKPKPGVPGDGVIGHRSELSMDKEVWTKE